MRNLKRLLTMALALAFMMSLMVVSTGAAFKDQDKIENTDAVDMNVALGIIKGRDTGDFDPAGNVTRGEMAKMICIALNGGIEPTLGTKTTAAYKDTKGHWAEAYIEYCTSLGIVSGMGDGNFAPDGKVTATQAAKMLLVALGYDAAKEGFNGPTWAIKINVAANQKNLFEDLTVDPNAPLNRDNAAQMIYNALNAYKVKYEYSLTTVNGQLQSVAVLKDDTMTLLKDKFKVTMGYGILSNVTYKKTDKKYQHSFIAMKSSLPADGVTLAAKTIDMDADYSNLFGQQVKVLYKEVNGKTTVFGMYAYKTKVVATGIQDDLGTSAEDGKIKFNGSYYKAETNVGTTVGTKVASDIEGLNFNVGAGLALNAIPGQFKVTLLDVDGNDYLDTVVYTPFEVAKITYVDSTSATTNNATYKFEDCDIYKDIKKDDWAMITAKANTANDKDTLQKLSVVTGEISAVKTGQVVMDGKTYTNATNVTVTGDTNYKIGNKMELVVVNTFVFNAKKLSATISKTNLVLATDKVDPAGLTGTDAAKQKAQLLFSDGTKKVVTVDKIDDKDVKNAGALAWEAGDVFLSTDAANAYKVNTVYTYAIDKDGNYELTPVAAPADYDNKYTVNGASTYKTGKLVAAEGTVRFADDAVIFYFDATAGKMEYKATTGAVVNKWAEYVAGKFTNGTLYTNKTDGFQYTQVGFMTLVATPTDKDTKYGYIVDHPQLVKSGDDYYYAVKIWSNLNTEATVYNAKSTKDITTITNSLNAMDADVNVKKGTPISFKIAGDKLIEDVTSVKSTANAVIAYTDGKDAVGFASNVAVANKSDLKTTSDTIVVRFSSKDIAGQAGTGITVAKETPVSGKYFANCYVVANSDGEIEGLIIDKDSAILTSTTLADATTTTDGKGLTGSKIGVDVSLADTNVAGVVTAIDGYFSNDVAVSVATAGGICTTATVYAQDGTAYTYNLVKAYTVASRLAAFDATDNVSVIADVQAAANATLAAAGAASVSVTLTTDGVNVGKVDATDVITVVYTALNGEVIASYTITAN